MCSSEQALESAPDNDAEGEITIMDIIVSKNAQGFIHWVYVHVFGREELPHKADVDILNVGVYLPRKEYQSISKYLGEHAPRPVDVHG